MFPKMAIDWQNYYRGTRRTSCGHCRCECLCQCEYLHRSNGIVADLLPWLGCESRPKNWCSRAILSETEWKAEPVAFGFHFADEIDEEYHCYLGCFVRPELENSMRCYYSLYESGSVFPLNMKYEDDLIVILIEPPKNVAGHESWRSVGFPEAEPRLSMLRYADDR